MLHNGYLLWTNEDGEKSKDIYVNSIINTFICHDESFSNGIDIFCKLDERKGRSVWCYMQGERRETHHNVDVAINSYILVRACQIITKPHIRNEKSIKYNKRLACSKSTKINFEFW